MTAPGELERDGRAFAAARARYRDYLGRCSHPAPVTNHQSRFTKHAVRLCGKGVRNPFHRLRRLPWSQKDSTIAQAIGKGS
jgi:hypothetical protein